VLSSKSNGKQPQSLSRAPILSPNCRHSNFVEERVNESYKTHTPVMQMFDSQELGIIRHARNTLSIRHQQPLYLSRQTLQFSPNTTLDRNLLATQYQSSLTPSPKQPSARSKSQLQFSVLDAKQQGCSDNTMPKDSIPRERYGFTVRPCSHNTPRPTTSGSISEHLKGVQFGSI
jgi:hypothetical protein